MSLIKVKEYFKKYNKDKDILEFNDSSATVSEAAQRLDCDEDLIAKTLSFKINDEPILIVLSGNTHIDNSKFKSTFHEKAKMLTKEEVSSLIGHEVGGVCPFGVNDGVTIYLDESLKKHDYVYPACGSDNSAIKLTISELEEYSNYDSYVDVGK